MSYGRFQVSVQWENREESPESCARRLARMLKGLATVHPDLRHWYMDARRQGPSTIPEKSLPSSVADLTAVFEQATRRKSSGALWPEVGYHLMAWNGIDDPRCVGFNAWPGNYADPRQLPNDVAVEFRPREPGNADLMTTEMLRRILISAVEAWEPACGSDARNG